MPRFSLREFSRPDYAFALLKKDPNNAIWPRISMIAKMLNEIPWFKKSEPTEEEIRDAARFAEDDVRDYPEAAALTAQAERATEDVSGLSDYYERTGGGRNEGLTDVFSGDRSPTRVVTENPNGTTYSLRHFKDSDMSNPEAVKNIQKELVDLGYDLGTYGPDRNGIDGSYGGRNSKTRKAHEDWKKKNMSAELDKAETWAKE